MLFRSEDGPQHPVGESCQALGPNAHGSSDEEPDPDHEEHRNQDLDEYASHRGTLESAQGRLQTAPHRSDSRIQAMGGLRAHPPARAGKVRLDPTKWWLRPCAVISAEEGQRVSAGQPTPSRRTIVISAATSSSTMAIPPRAIFRPFAAASAMSPA